MREGGESFSCGYRNAPYAPATKEGNGEIKTSNIASASFFGEHVLGGDLDNTSSPNPFTKTTINLQTFLQQPH